MERDKQRGVKVHFLGAAGMVTGSRFLIETPELNILIDCGMFQGLKSIREHNWEPFAFSPQKIDMVLLTHGHLDHTGYLPRLVNSGFSGPIIGTAPTLAITRIILKDSAKIQEEQAEKANKEGYSKHHPAIPLYTLDDAEKTFRFFQQETKDQWIRASENVKYRFRYNGHILGATFIELDIYEKMFVFSGDIGRIKDVLLYPPQKPRWADYLFLESTYGDRIHVHEPIDDILTDLIHKTIHNRGTLLIPSFAVERLQTLVYLLWKLARERHIPEIPIYVDSPMGQHILDVFEVYSDWHRFTREDFESFTSRMQLISSYKETWETIDDPQPKVVIAGSGMVTGGRILTYLQQLIDREETTILLVGYQAEGTRGRDLMEGVPEIKFFGKYYPVKAAVHHIESLSAHADQSEIIDWLSDVRNIPEAVFLTHGEAAARTGLQKKIQESFGWHTNLPELYETASFLL